MSAFTHLRAAPTVLRCLGNAPPELRRSLVRALEEIRAKRLRMIPAGRPGLYLAFAVDHMFLASATPDGETLVVLDLIYDPEEDLP